MLIFGRYHKKLFKIFFIIAIIISTIFSSLVFSYLYYLNNSSYKDNLHSLVLAKSDSINLTLKLIWDLHANIEHNITANEWATTELYSSKYYYDSLKLYNYLTKESAYKDNLDYQIFVSRKDEESFVVSQKGTMVKNSFIENEISSEIWQTIKTLNQGPYIFPLYEDNILSYILLCSLKKNGLVVFTKIPMTSLFKATDNYIAITLQDYHFSDKTYNAFDLALLDQAIKEGNSTFKINTNYCYVVATKIPNLKFCLLYSAPFKQFISIILISSTIFLFILALFIFIANSITKILYSPIYNTVNKLESKKDKNYDEFAILNKNLNTIGEYRTKLDKLVNENESLSISKYYRDLLYSNNLKTECPLSEKDINAKYFVAEIKIDYSSVNLDEYKAQLQRALLLEKLQDLQDANKLRYINISHSRIALIFKDLTEKEIKQVLNEIFNLNEFIINLSISLSSEYLGCNKIYDCFQEAEILLEYRYLFPYDMVITFSDIPKNDSNYFYFPIDLENQLVNNVISGKEENALKIFDFIITENFENRVLKKEAHQNLIYSLVSTLIRIMQELKMSCIDLIGREFDYPWLYASWGSDKIVPRLRNNICQIIEGLNKKNLLSTSDESLLSRMQEYVFANYSQDIMLQDVADALNITPKYCSTLFKRLSNENFKNFLNEYRIKIACERIKENPIVKISDLAKSVGFNSANTFIRVFKNYTLLTPGQYAESLQ